MIGEKINQYLIKSLLGEGGMGNVYLGEHTSIGRKVAIKVLRPELASNQEIRSRFKNEASVMAHLQHPGIVSLFDYVEQDDGLYLIMEYVQGQELAHKIEGLSQPMNINEASRIMILILEAFECAHNSGIVHRDVKPANILIDKSNNVKVLDFGIAKIVGSEQFNLTKAGSQVGTAYYMSPEQVKAHSLDKRSDIYSLGVTFYEMLVGFCPYKSLTSEYEISDAIVNEPLVSLVETMGDEYSFVWDVIKKATEKKVTNRYQSCSEMIQALKNDVKVVSSSKSNALGKTKNITTSAPPKGSDSNKKIIIPTIAGVVLIAGFFLIKPLLVGKEEAAPPEVEELAENESSYDESMEEELETETPPPAVDVPPLTYKLFKKIDLSKKPEKEISPPFYIINTAAVKIESEAKKKVQALEEEGYKAGYLWIPDYASLSGAEYFTVFIGPFETKQECAIAVDNYHSINPKAYGTLVSHDPGRVTVGGLNEAN
tara:strand:- start:250 stop:1704 length:1455 start_codon:yes stop_codon:yes gene_type:complete